MAVVRLLLFAVLFVAPPATPQLRMLLSEHEHDTEAPTAQVEVRRADVGQRPPPARWPRAVGAGWDGSAPAPRASSERRAPPPRRVVERRITYAGDDDPDGPARARRAA